MSDHPNKNHTEKTSIIYRFFSGLWWVLESQWWVVIEHSDGLKKCKEAESPTATAVLIWAPIMCFPQWLIAPVFGLKVEAMAVLFARITAMCIVRKLDGIMPLTRALGLCHLVTFGPVLCLLLISDHPTGENFYFDLFVLSQIYIIGLCLLLDTRDFFFYLGGYPYPCCIREGVIGGQLQIEDSRAHVEVTWRSRLVEP